MKREKIPGTFNRNDISIQSSNRGNDITELGVAHVSVNLNFIFNSTCC